MSGTVTTNASAKFELGGEAERGERHRVAAAFELERLGGQCVNNYLENNSNVPWHDIKYIIGEIMYGGHVVEDWDRRTNGDDPRRLQQEETEVQDFFPKFARAAE